MRKKGQRVLAVITIMALLCPADSWARVIPTITAPVAVYTVKAAHKDKVYCGCEGVDPTTGLKCVPGQELTHPAASPALVAAPVFNSGSNLITVWGRGWTSDSDQSIALSEDRSATWIDGTGAQTTFFATSASTVTAPAYSVPINSYLTLTAVTASSGVPTGLLVKQKDGTKLQFGVAESTSVLRLSLLTDRVGNTVAYTRDSQGRLTHLQDVHGRYFDISYNPAGYVSTLADSGGRSSSYVYDAQGHRTSETGPQGTTGYAYDAQNRMAKITYPNGGVKNYMYDVSGRVLTEDDGAGQNALSYAYYGSSTAVTDVLNRTTVYQYTKQQGLTKVTSVTDPDGRVTRYAYDANLNLASITDTLGRVTTYTYDANGNVTVMKDPAAGLTRASYEPVFNHPTAITDPLNHTTNMAYDVLGNLTQIQDAAAAVSKKSYDSMGHVTQDLDPLGHATAYGYEPSNGALASVTDPLGHTTLMTTDPLSRVTLNTDPTNKTTQYQYDVAGNVTQVTDAMGNVTHYTYDPGRSQKLLKTVTDANGHTTTFGYDAQGRVTSVTNALNQTKTSQYDAKGNLVQTMNARGQVTTYTYDALDRLTRKTMPEGQINYAYDAAGNVTQITHYNGSSIQNTYDSLNRLTQQIQTLPNGYAATIGYTYDAAGNRTSMTTPWGGFSYQYDTANRLIKITNPQSKMFTFAYDAAGRRTQLNYPNGVQTNYTYDSASRVLSIIAKRTSDNVVVSSVAYAYDAAGNRTSMTDWEGVHSYGYDDLHRLTSVQHPVATVLPVRNETFSYDGVGNRLADAQIGGYAYDSANRLTLNSSFTYTYDADGNLASKADTGTSTTYSFNSFNQLTGLVLPNSTAWTYKYDGNGRRVEKSSGTGAGQTSGYIYDGPNILALLDSGNNPAQIFTNGLNIDEPFSMRQASGTEYAYHQDALGSVHSLTDFSGILSERYSYLSYGLPFVTVSGGSRSAVSIAGNFLMYTAREFDVETGFDNDRRRTLDPITGSFTAEDPLGVVSGTNLYQYVGSRPTGRVDPYGLYPAGAQADDQFHIDEGIDPTYLEVDIVFFFVGGELFGKVINSNRYLRIGPSGKGGRRVFRIAGDLLDKVCGQVRKHIDLFDLGPK